jgi:multiple sugar transport system substrate-binding protein
MNILSKASIVGIAFLTSATISYAADCGIGKSHIRILSNDFPALHSLVDMAKECANSKVKVTVNHTSEHKNLQVAALKPNPAEYSAVVISNGSFIPLYRQGLLRPLDKYVAKYGAGLQKSQLITFGGKVMSIAFMANTQHLIYREDILKKAGVGVPTTLEEVLAACEIIRSKGLLEHPFAAAYKAGWNLAEEFVNMYLGHGGKFFKSGSPNPNINNKTGVAALKALKALTSYSNPDFLTFESEGVKAQWEAGKVALMFMWASRAPTLLDNEGSTPEIVANTKLTGPVTVAGGSTPVGTLWWDGFVISKNVSEADAEASFQALVRGASSSEMANKNSGQAVWLIKDFEPGPLSVGVLAAAKAGANSYPMEPHMGLMHNAIGAEIIEFLQGRESAEKALADVEAAYVTAAKEAGFLK